VGGRPSLDGSPPPRHEPLQQRGLGFEEVAAAGKEISLSRGAQPNAPIEDHKTTTSTIRFDEAADLSRLTLDLDVGHTWRGDLVVTLTSPSGKTATLSNREGGSRDDIQGSFDLSSTFAGEPLQGDWTLTVEDRAARDVGTLRSWSLQAVGTEKPPPGPVVTPVAIEDLESRYGWKAGGWQDRLLRAADQKTGSPDGKVTAAEVDQYLADPDDLQFLTSQAMQQQRAEVAGGAKAVDQFAEGWQRDLARAADGNRDGSLTASELNSHLTRVKSAPESAATLWMPDQKASPFGSRIADFTGEADLLTPEGELPNGVLLSKNYMRISADSERRVPQWVGYQLTAADIAERPSGVVRRDNFKPDPELGSQSAQLSDYKGSGFDRGHQRPARDSVNQESMDESFLLSNMTPQTNELNTRAWNLLEQATWEVVQATGAKATIFTGGMFLDAQGNKLPDDQVQWIGANGQKRVAVPTHSFKAVLLQMPDGKVQSYAFICPNVTNVGNKLEEQASFLKAHRVSIDQIEGKLGEDLFSALDPATQAAIEADPNPAIHFADPSKWKAAALLWPQ
jgi:endonuclease G